MFARTCIPPADRLLHAVFTPVAAGCSGRALSVLVHTRCSWTCWSCLAGRVQLLMLAGKLPCSLQLSVVVSQPCCLIPARLLQEALKGISFFVIAMKGHPDRWETGKERCGAFACFWKRALFYSSHVVVCLEMGWTGHARESIHYRFLAFSVLTLYSFAPPTNCPEQKIQ